MIGSDYDNEIVEYKRKKEEFEQCKIIIKEILNKNKIKFNNENIIDTFTENFKDIDIIENKNRLKKLNEMNFNYLNEYILSKKYDIGGFFFSKW